MEALQGPTSKLHMSQDVSIVNDLKTAAVLAGSAGLLGAVTVPFLLPSIFELVPPEQRTLPVPLPLFCVVLAIQFLIIYGLLALAGLRLARARNREPAPLLSATWAKKSPGRFGWPAGLAFGTGLLCGTVLVVAIALIKRFLPQTLPDTLHPSSFWGALLASATASFGEEILCRLFLLSAMLRVLPVSSKSTVVAVVVSSLLFAALHAPAAAFIFGGLHNVPHLFWVWMVSLNAFVGVACAVWYLRVGIGGAILVHSGADLVWHVLSQWF
jgi:membrane protease YdiL (CAAX protease family)